MAELKPGAIGMISGKVDNVIGSNWRDIWVLRGTAKKSSKQYSPAQIAQRAKFALVYELLSRMEDVLNAGFGNLYTGKSTAFNQAFGANMNAVKGTYPSFSIDFPALVLAKGHLAPCANALPVSREPHSIQLTWADLYPAEPSDKVTAVVCEPEKGITTFSRGVAVRGDYKMDIVVPEMFSEKDVHVFLFFTSPDGKKNSASVYAGQVTVF